MYKSRLIRTGAILFVLIANIVNASTDTAGPNGINSIGLLDASGAPLVGTGVSIGQVEEGRPGKHTAPPADNLANSNTTTVPAAVFIRETAATMDDAAIGDHAQWVAGILISSDATDPNMDGDMPTGIATGAALYSSAYVTSGIAGIEHALVAAQHISTEPGVFVVNTSWAKPRAMGTELNGNSLLTLGFDWMARAYDVLYVVAGNQAGETNSVPTDHFNGITVAASDKIGDTYRRVWTDNRYDDDANGDERTSISLIAPGVDVELTGLGNVPTRDSGTSLAAPHVTGTVALLHQYAEERVMTVGAPRWTGFAGRHEVMKAVLMNSADKLIDDGTVMVNGNAVPVGGLLGMQRTVLKQDGVSTWLDSIAYDDSLEGSGGFYPLDEQMGAGHLNATRALQQYSPGEYASDSGDVPTIAWDYGFTTGANDINRYPLAGSLLAEHFISITLAWDRVVQFDVDADMDGQYDMGDTFQESTATFPTPDSDDLINNLDVFLLPKGSATITQAVAQSVSSEGTLQHIFFQIPETDEFEIWVRQFDADIAGGQGYALAWWYGVAPPLIVQGDYNGDGIVDAQDYAEWNASFGDAVSPGAGADGNGDGTIDAADYVVWRHYFDEQSGSGSLVSAPEPASFYFALVAVVFAASGLSRNTIRREGTALASR